MTECTLEENKAHTKTALEFAVKNIPTALHIDFIAACCLLAHGSTLVLLYAAVPSAALGGTAPH